MPKKIDWLYFRKHCVTCQRAKGYLDKHDIPVADVADANKDRKGRAEALKLAATVDKIIAAKGKKQVTFDMKKDRPDDETLLKHLMGPTGNLRAPTARIGKTLYVGFTEDSYAPIVGK